MDTIYDMEGNRSRQDAQRLSDQQAAIERLEAERDAAIQQGEDELHKLRRDGLKHLGAMRTELDAAYAQVVELRSVLEAAEWTGAFQPFAEQQCHWCGHYEKDGHRDDCSREAALAGPSPQADALAVVLGLMDKWQETAFKSDWESVDEDLFAAWDAYLAVTRGDGGAANE